MSTSKHYQSWGRFPKGEQQAIPIQWRDEPLPEIPPDTSLLPHGLGRSYGDVCLNHGGSLLPTRSLNRFIAFDADSGVLRCESGVSLAEILAHCVPQGWFLPVTPGTRFATIGGAIANDVHGKNHHCAGTFGRHVRCFELLRSDGQRLLCSPMENQAWFNATISGLGLTGLITWAEIRMKPICHRAMQADTIQFGNVEEFFALSEESAKNYEYSVSWVDCLSQGQNLGRGLFSRGNHVAEADKPDTWKVPSRTITMPIDLPGIALNRLSVRTFNELYYRRQGQKMVSALVDYEPFFYPLDGILQWNRLYGKSGFLQYQCVVPAEDHRIIRNLLDTIALSGMSSFLAVLKVFGDVPSPGMLSFPQPGVTLALDFPIKGAKTFALLSRLDDQVREAGGRVYPAKDARLSAPDFQAWYPQWQAFMDYIDPRFSSGFWRRVTRTIGQ